MKDKGEKKHLPTAQRLKKARDEGNVFRSTELLSVGVLLAGGAGLVFCLPRLFDTLQAVATRTFLNATNMPLRADSVAPLLMDTAVPVLLTLVPLFLLLTAAGLGLNVAQTGWNLTAKPLQPKPNKIDPVAGTKRLFSSKSLFNAAKAIIKILIVAPIAFFTIQGRLPEIVLLHTLPLETILSTASGWILLLVLKLLLALTVLSVPDFAFEKWKYTKDLKMTDQEVKEERKQQEGDPAVKGQRLKMARELALRPRLDHAVLKADVVVTNPTHYAIALHYRPEEMMAPRVLAKGLRKRALRIKALAQEHGVPTVEDRPLARALYDGVAEGGEIPEELYPAVATILAEIYRQRPPGRA